jgi:hypothetical protein
VRNPWIPVAAVGVAALVVVLAISPYLRLTPSPNSPPQLLIPGPIVNSTISVGPAIGYHPADPFYSVVFNTGGMNAATLRALGAYFNSTPISLFRWGGTANYDPTTSTVYEPPAGGTGAYIAVPGLQSTLNLTWMKAWCHERTQHCSWIGSLPAEQNSILAAVHAALWYHTVLGFSPTYWQLGNEPESWIHYGENWTVWSTADHSTPTALQYATMVRNYISAVRLLYPSDQFVGIEASGPGPIVGFVATTAELNGGQVEAMAYHSYPPPVGGGSALDQLYASLQGPQNVTATVTLFRAAIANGCSTCSGLPVQIGEFQAGPAGAIDPLATTYAGAPFLAAAIIEALRMNVSTFSPYDNTWMVNRTTGAVLPEGLLYQRMLENMTMGTDYATTVDAPGVGGVYSLLLENGTRQSLLVVNTNTTASLRLALPTSSFANGTEGSYWQWGPSVPDPIASRSIILPSQIEIPEEGILLVDNY